MRAIAFYKELDVIDYEKELAIVREETKGLKKADHMDSPVKNSDESTTKTLSMDPFLSFRYEEPNMEKAKKVYIHNSPKKKETTADKTWALYLEHFDLQKIATIRGLKKNTILEHMITKLPDDRIRIEDMIDMTGVTATFYFKDGTILKIESEFGEYNNNTLDINFKSNIKAEYEESILKAQYAEYSNSKGFLKITDDVIVNDIQGNLTADKLLFDIKSQTLKIETFNENKISVNVDTDEKRF